MFSLKLVWTNCWTNSQVAGAWRRHYTHVVSPYYSRSEMILNDFYIGHIIHVCTSYFVSYIHAIYLIDSSLEPRPS